MCDDYFDSEKLCDPYVEIYINGELSLKTSTATDVFTTSWILNYRSPKISKDSTVRFEMWEHDTWSPDDPLLIKSVTIEEMINVKSWVIRIL